MAEAYDVIIIGSGAGGGTLARHLAPSGKRILILERGGWLPRELENWDAEEVFVKNRYVPKETWYDKNGKAFQPGVHYWVGGATKLYGAALYRLRKEDFGELRHHDGISPAWPISLRRDGAVLHPGRADLPGPRRARRRSHRAAGQRALSLPGRLARAAHPAAARRPGARPVITRSTRRAASCSTKQHAAFSPCIRCKDCDGFPCLVHAKSDAEVLGVRPALQYPNVTLLTNAQVVKLNTDAAGTRGHRGGRRARRPAARPTRAASSSSPAAPPTRPSCCCMSANDKHPRGLANGSDQVGRNYMFHNSVAVLAISKEPNPTKFQKTLGLNDFYFGMPGFDFPMGNIQMVGKSQGPMYKGEKPIEAGLAPMFTLDEVAKHAVDFWLSTEDLPRPENRVTVERDGNIQLSYTPTNQVPKQQLYDKLKSMLNHLGMHEHLIPRNLYMKNEIEIGGVRPPGRHLSLRHRPEDLRARRQLQGARARQPVRRRHQLLPEHRRGESGADGDGQRAARRRSSAAAAG